MRLPLDEFEELSIAALTAERNRLADVLLVMRAAVHGEDHAIRNLLRHLRG